MFETMRMDLNAALGTALGAINSGARMQEGWYELFFYLRTAKRFDNVASSVMKGYATYSFETGTSRDTHWSHYRKELYPDELMLQQIKSRSIIDELVLAGDDIAKSRPVEHYLLFQTEAQALRALDVLASSAFVLQERFEQEGAFAYGLLLTKTHEVTQERLMDETGVLLDAIRKEHGSYEGWSTMLAK